MKSKFKKIIDWLILAYVFLLPWQTVYIFDEKTVNGAKSQFLTGQLYATEAILWLIIISYLLAYFRPADLKKLSLINIKLADKKRLFISALWLFLAYSGLSILWAGERSAAFYLWFRFLEGAALGLAILTVNTPKIKLLWALLLSAGLQGLLATWQFLSQTIPANKWLGIAYHSAGIPGDIVIETASGRWLRAYGAFSHPNILGGFLVFALISAGALWLHYFRSPDRQFDLKNLPQPLLKNPAAKKFLKLWLKLLAVAALALLAGAGLFFSFSRSAWLALILVLPIFLFFAKKSIALRSRQEIFQFSLFPLGLIFLFISFFFIFNPLVLARADLSNRLETRSQTERISQTSEAWAMIKTAPLLGTGLNNYTWRLNKTNPGQPAYRLQPVHNIYLLIAAELGLIGLALFLILILSGWRLSQKQFLLAPFAAIFIIGLFDHYFLSQYIGIMMIYLSLTFAWNSDNL